MSLIYASAPKFYFSYGFCYWRMLKPISSTYYFFMNFSIIVKYFLTLCASNPKKIDLPGWRSVIMGSFWNLNFIIQWPQNGCRSVHRKSERNFIAMVCNNSLGVFSKSCWLVPLLLSDSDISYTVRSLLFHAIILNRISKFVLGQKLWYFENGHIWL